MQVRRIACQKHLAGTAQKAARARVYLRVHVQAQLVMTV
jgi:hypothetical protein